MAAVHGYNYADARNIHEQRLPFFGRETPNQVYLADPDGEDDT